jgi:hypothetical protein
VVTDRLTTLLADVRAISTLDAAAREASFHRAVWTEEATNEEIDQFLQSLLESEPPPDRNREKLIAIALHHIVVAQRGASKSSPRIELEDSVLERAAELYRHWGSRHAASPLLLCMLTSARTPPALADFAELITTDPPPEEGSVASVFGPLFQRADYDPGVLFPQLLDGITHASVAPMILDLANFVTRKGWVREHPGTPRQAAFVSLLGALVGRLGALESATPTEAGQMKALSRQVADGVSIAISLCDALALIGDRSAVGKLYQALELSHRRLRVEAAAALARLEEKMGIEVLVQMAEEPVVRLRVLAYTEELGLLDKVESKFRTGEARAEAELFLHLAQPTQMGVPPNSSELVDARTQSWPGFEGPVDCYLLRFVYHIGEVEFSNIGMAGPLTHAFAADLSDLPPDDIYAAFAGWQAEGQEIHETDIANLTDSQRAVATRLEQRLSSEGFQAIEPLTLGFFFGDHALVATAQRDESAGVVVADDRVTRWWPRGVNQRPIGPLEAYCIYKGRRLLRAFN